jgi:hypothetical protein
VDLLILQSVFRRLAYRWRYWIRSHILFFCSTAFIIRTSYCPDYRHSEHFWNVGKLLPDHTAEQPRRQASSYLPPWEPEIWQWILGQSVSLSSFYRRSCSPGTLCDYVSLLLAYQENKANLLSVLWGDKLWNVSGKLLPGHTAQQPIFAASLFDTAAVIWSRKTWDSAPLMQNFAIEHDSGPDQPIFDIHRVIFC